MFNLDNIQSFEEYPNTSIFHEFISHQGIVMLAVHSSNLILKIRRAQYYDTYEWFKKKGTWLGCRCVKLLILDPHFNGKWKHSKVSSIVQTLALWPDVLNVDVNYISSDEIVWSNPLIRIYRGFLWIHMLYFFLMGCHNERPLLQLSGALLFPFVN